MPRLPDPMTLPGEAHEARLHAVEAETLEEVHGLFHRIGGVVVPMEEDGRSGYPVQIRVGRGLEPTVPVGPRVTADVPPGHVVVESGTELAPPIRHHGSKGGSLEPVRLCDRPATEDPTVTPSPNSQGIRVGDPPIDHGIHPRHHVLEVALPDVLQVPPEQGVSVAGGASDVGL